MAKTTQTKTTQTKTQSKSRTKRKRPSASKQAGPRQAQDSVNRLYVAHQVHTLANVLFHQISRAGVPQTQQPQQPAPAFGLGATPWNAAGPWQPAAAAPHGASQPLLYWYP